jgi:tight adherence protein C
MSQIQIIAALAGGLAVGSVMWILLSPYKRLAPRVRPYAAVSRSRLARSYDVAGMAFAASATGESTIQRLFGPMIDATISWFSQLLGAGNDEQLATRLRHAGMYSGVPAEQRVREFRVRSLGQSLLMAAGLGAFGVLVGGTQTMMLFGVLGFVVGIAVARSRVNSAVRVRRERLRAELYTFNQLIALRTRVGGGVVDALKHAVDRGNGVFVDELAEVLRLQASGVSMSDALRRAAAQTSEPEAQRTYNVLATAQDRGADLGDALLDLSKDLRAQRRDDLQQAAARRRLMLIIPIVIILAPVLLLFIGAPVPSLIFGTG